MIATLTSSLMIPFFLLFLSNMLLATDGADGLLILGPAGPVPLGPGTNEPAVETGDVEPTEAAGEAGRGTSTLSNDVSSLIREPVKRTKKGWIGFQGFNFGKNLTTGSCKQIVKN